MKKLIYYIAFLLLLFFINLLPTSAKEILTCERSKDDLKVREELKNNNNQGAILETPCVDASSKIYDFADLLSDQEEETLFLEVSDFIKETNYDLAIVTINENPKGTARNYADDFYDYNNFGNNATRDGLVFLIDMDTRELYISTTGYAIKTYDDSRIESILDSGYYYISDEEYYEVFSNMIEKTSYYYSLGTPNDNENLIFDDNGNPYYVREMPYVLIIFLTVIITLIPTLICYFKTRLKIKVLSTNSYLENQEITLKTDRLVNTIITHTPRYSSSGGSGSSGSGSSSHGGSSFHSSSSSSSHGGGGRHF